MKIHKTLRCCALAVVAGLLVANAAAQQVTVSRILVPGYGDEFNVTPIVGTGYSPLAVVSNGYETFCLSRNVNIGLPGSYFYLVDSNGIYQPDGLPITKGVAWLYSQFATGVLAGYDYANTGGTNRANWAFELQTAIWGLENNGTYPLVPANPFVAAAQNFFGGGSNGLAVAMSPMSPGDFNVGALNLNSINADGSMGAAVQPLLTLLPPACNGQIGDFVWNDLNGNGCQDANEPGLPGVRVDLYAGCGVSGTPIDTKTTDSSGHYLFSGLCSGQYSVSFTTPAGYARTVANVGCFDPNLPPNRNQLDSKCTCAAGTLCFCVTLTGGNAVNLNADCGYVILPSANCVTISAVKGVAITPVTMTGTDGCGGPYTFSATGLPGGLSMSSVGTISGTPTVSGTFNYTVTIADACGNQGTVNCSVTVNPPPTANCVTINAVQGVTITPVTMTASGGCGGPYTFTVTGLPTGLSMSASGTISGTPTVSGTFNYSVTITDNCGDKGTVNCSVTVLPPQLPPVSHGDTATIGFWHNKNGQALIKAMNGGPTSTQLGTWLGTNYPCLFGALNGRPNTAVAAQFLIYFNVTGQKTYAQVMAGALAAYTTSSTLAGSSVAGGYGFNVSTTGTGAKTYNTGSNGTAIGLLNNTSYTVSQLLQAANAKCPWNSAAFNALNTIFDGINTSGDIL